MLKSKKNDVNEDVVRERLIEEISNKGQEEDKKS
jgi:hypothetical protein